MLDNKKNCGKAMLSLCAALLGADATAGTMNNSPDAAWNYILALSAGPVWQNEGKTQTLFLTPDIEKTYSAQQSSQVIPDGELFLGIQKKWHSFLTGQIGVAVATTGKGRLQGVIWDDADPQFDNYVYNYKVQHTHVALKGKLLSDVGFIVTPWVSASVGAGFNQASDFLSRPVIYEAVPTPEFNNQTKTAFTYTLGAGVQRQVGKNWQVGVGYEFADWGKNQLGRAFEQTLGTGLSLEHFYTHGVMIHVAAVV
ncbi:outer membrane protein [Legionella worsleiensis]|uniref:Opacity protein and related surface antigens n=1 Tax=Legionella worsleiensis TaxID=45076 RepID=A0A0W1A471_9GAMM|nr:porin family protein [Legionella worsleiensis]KTD76000.1 hypothetical protein Lwor_2566 [Legionella worsleiensis]STY33013.1 Opacity protein and related surface antigens [Legionella worsleiensis]